MAWQCILGWWLSAPIILGIIWGLIKSSEFRQIVGILLAIAAAACYLATIVYLFEQGQCF